MNTHITLIAPVCMPIIYIGHTLCIINCLLISFDNFFLFPPSLTQGLHYEMNNTRTGLDMSFYGYQVKIQ